MFDELCHTGRTSELEHIHLFTQPCAVQTYINRGRVVSGTPNEHFDTIADRWIATHHGGTTVAITTATNEHVGLLNDGPTHATSALSRSSRTLERDLASRYGLRLGEASWSRVKP